MDSNILYFVVVCFWSKGLLRCDDFSFGRELVITNIRIEIVKSFRHYSEWSQLLSTSTRIMRWESRNLHVPASKYTENKHAKKCLIFFVTFINYYKKQRSHNNQWLLEAIILLFQFILISLLLLFLSPLHGDFVISLLEAEFVGIEPGRTSVIKWLSTFKSFITNRKVSFKCAQKWCFEG